MTAFAKDTFIEDAGHRIVFLLVSSDDGETEITGITPTVQISINGGSFAAASGSPAEIGNGWYYIDLSSTELGTVGPVIVRAYHASSKVWRSTYEVVATAPDVNVASSDVTLDANVVSFDGSFTLPDVTIADESMTALALRYLGSDVADARAAGELPEDIQFTPAGVIVRNGREEVNGSSLEVYEEDKATVAYTRAITTVETPVYIGGLS